MYCCCRGAGELPEHEDARRRRVLLLLLLQVRLMRERGYVIGNIDCTIIAQVCVCVGGWVGGGGTLCSAVVCPVVVVLRLHTPLLDASLPCHCLQRPKMSPHKETIRDNLCRMLGAHPRQAPPPPHHLASLRPPTALLIHG